MSDLIARGLRMIGMDEERIAPVSSCLESYVNELLRFNPIYGLIGTDVPDEIRVRHVLDSLAALPILEAIIKEQGGDEGCLIGDIGAGGGLPGIPLAAALPAVQFVLVERMSRRCLFLENTAAVLNLKNVRVEQAEAERLPKERFTLLVFRAFRPLDIKRTQHLFSLLKKGGKLAAYKARSEKIKAEMAGLAGLIGEYSSHPLSVPFLDGYERHLVLIDKPAP